MENVDRLEQFWRDFVRVFPETVEVEGATVAHFLQIPVALFNHATNINIAEGKAEVFIQAITDNFSSIGLPFVCCRVSPLTPLSFVSFLERHGFEKESEQSIMVFDGKLLGNSANSRVTVKDTNDVDTFDRLVVKGFEMPSEWKEAFDKLVAPFKGKNVKHYLAYLDNRPVGTASLFSASKVGCIINVSTLREYRKQGIATELTIYAVSESVKAGNNLLTLQTEKGSEAERLYRKIGFEIDHTVSFLIKKLS
jgi:GNAT superfamily N-acetyltransferase